MGANKECVKPSNSILCFTFTLMCLSDQTFGQDADVFLTKYRGNIVKYIMKGYGDGWTHCDVIHDVSETKQTNFYDETPSFVMDVDKLHTMDIPRIFSSSFCLLISAHVKSNQSLSDLIKFGWSVVQRKRVALVLEMSDGMNLDMATNITKLPFLVAARLEGGAGEQFLCPIIGDTNPGLQDSNCDSSYISYKDKTLRTGVFGLPPYFYGKLWF